MAAGSRTGTTRKAQAACPLPLHVPTLAAAEKMREKNVLNVRVRGSDRSSSAVLAAASPRRRNWMCSCSRACTKYQMTHRPTCRTQSGLSSAPLLHHPSLPAGRGRWVRCSPDCRPPQSSRPGRPLPRPAAARGGGGTAQHSAFPTGAGRATCWWHCISASFGHHSASISMASRRIDQQRSGLDGLLA